MNYRHAFHAGNFADVVKHVLLARLVAYLQRKDKPFRVFDTHGGRGLYDLGGDEARRTGEAEDGIRRLATASTEILSDPLFASYWEAVREDVAAGRYPGSPLLVRRLLRPQDRLSAYELHPADAAALRALFAGDTQVKTIELDAWLALGAHLPPKEKRGLVFIDPPFEKPSEVDDIATALARAMKRWPGGTYAVWYPMKRQAMVAALRERLAALAPEGVLFAEFLREAYAPEERFVGSGLAVLNPPFIFPDEAEAILTRLLPVFERGMGATSDVFTRR
ncbi:23S rRNA (adenine(2030)-N(6))-methyltransferase RlmJ [Aurantimonas sp. VKM B-3413]|uniref:23S rRNA (adenine(2030)-N(6))-methyltransferase RlmJ n=1 Tax=Aurantimonas sp. VKM B-3413 TaxID=2779401 RepID=UPI001E61A180|nr:23S rRNA (adenine(2030)-N(6))-methyltransferase RlmJ [Aurantimonas sp. VKM B-3413]